MLTVGLYKINMTKTYFFLSGLPRSGSTLLSSILNQNPNIYCSPDESFICDLIFRTDFYINNSDEYNSCTNKNGRNNICSSIIENYYSNKTEKYIIDKCRTWGTPDNLNFIRKYITNDIKIICPVRPILEVLTSFIHLFNQNEGRRIFIDTHIQSNGRYFYRPLNDIRCDELMKMNGTIDQALFSLSQSKLPQNKDIFHIIEYDDLVFETEKTIKKLYDFLNLEYFNHDFKNISSSNEINHNYYGMPDLHKVRRTIEKTSPVVENVLSDYVIQKYRNYNVWN
jgi:sulfotransferase